MPRKLGNNAGKHWKGSWETMFAFLMQLWAGKEDETG